MLVACLLTFLFGLTVAAPTTPGTIIGTTPEPPNGIRQCARSECPVYTLLEDYGSDMWKRRIEPGLWARKVSPTCNFTSAASDVYLDLHYYFMDNNISRTTPIMLEISENKARPTFCPDQLDFFPCCEKIYGLFFYISAASNSTTVPQPSKESGIELVYMHDPREFYGINFDGRATVPNVTAKYDELVEFLSDQDIAFDDDTFIEANYDAPWRPKPHRNEVLIPVKRGRRNKNRSENDGENENETENGGEQGGDGEGDGNGSRRGERGRKRRSLSEITNIDLFPF